MERKSTKINHERVYQAIEKVLSAINSERGTVEFDGISLKIGNSLRKNDLYSIISEVSGLGLCEETIRRLYRKYRKTHGYSENHTRKQREDKKV